MMKDFYYYMHLCAEAGVVMNVNMIKRLRQIFQTEYQREKRKRERKEKLYKEYGIEEQSLCVLFEGYNPENTEQPEYEIYDFSESVEDKVINKILKEQLRRYMDELEESDRNILLLKNAIGATRASQVLDIPLPSLKRRYKKAFEKIQNKFFEKK